MLCSTRASPGFERALLELVALVHCHRHGAGIPKESRLEAWKRAFPPGTTDGSEPEDPLEQRVRTALGVLDARYTAQDNGERCKRMVGGQKMQNCGKTIQELNKPNAHASDTKLELLLKVLEWNRTCSTHESSRQFTWVAAWKTNILAVLSVSAAPLGAQSDSPIARTALMTAQEGLAVMQTAALPYPQASSELTITLSTVPALYWPKTYDTSPFEIVANANTIVESTLPHKLIRSEMSKNLGG